jgi:hypothetical protein
VGDTKMSRTLSDCLYCFPRLLVHAG